MTLDPRHTAVSLVLDAVREIRLDASTLYNDSDFIQLWFNRRLRPFLPAMSTDFLSCLSTKNLSCSTYQDIVQILSGLQMNMSFPLQMSIYTNFIKGFLTRNETADPGCSMHPPNSGEWIKENLGGFSALLSFNDLQMLHPNFNVMEALPQLTVRQLAEVASTPGQLTSPAQVTIVTDQHPQSPPRCLFDDLSAGIMSHETVFPAAVRSAMLQVVYDRANLSDHSVSDSVVSVWLQKRLLPLLVSLSPQHVMPFFKILARRNCSIEQQGIKILNSTIATLGGDTKREIYNHIIWSLKGSPPLRCYGDNYNHSFYVFLEQSFLGFQFPNLTTFLSLMPESKMHLLLNSMAPSDLGQFLRRPGIIDDDMQLCIIYTNYMKTPEFIEQEDLPALVRRLTLPCIWPMALSSSKRSEVNAWFDLRLPKYMVFLTKHLLASSTTQNASCLAFQKLVSVLGKYNYSVSDFTRQDVFITIKAYLTSVTLPKCYNDSDPDLNSTAWFAEYIGSFMSFLTLEDLQTFGSAEVIKVFTVNPQNIALLNHSVLPRNLTDYYTELIYLQDSKFNPLLLPLLCRCAAPPSAFMQLDAAESKIILQNLTVCTDVDPQVFAVLAYNFGDDIDVSSITSLGNESVSLSTGQIQKIKPKDLQDSLDVLSKVTGWNQGQAWAIVQILMSTGTMQINSSSSLLTLGSLVVGVPASVFSSIDGSQLLSASKDPTLVEYMMQAPAIVQETFVAQIISLNNNSEAIIWNVPDEMATEIPRSLLLGFSDNITVLDKLNRKKWKRQQAELFFEVIAVQTATTALGGPNNLSSSVLQGFTCTKVSTFQMEHITKLIKACRRKGKDKVPLVETQLTCMYNYIKGQPDATSYELYPPDMLLYYNYSLVSRDSCRSYFVQLAAADFSVFSEALSYKRSELFTNAKSCLGITNTTLSPDNILVLGNMCCILDGSYIENSDSSIIEKLKNCPDLSSAQVQAIETLLQSGTSQYGPPSTWNEQTLKDLGMLPLYLSSDFYGHFDKKTKKAFLKYFLRVLKQVGVDRSKIRQMKNAIMKSLRKKSKRSVGSDCTVGEITDVTISDSTFPFNYDDITQFNNCLSALVVKNNLASITAKVDQVDYLRIILNKLNEAYANSSIPEDQVQLLGPASRVATIDDINMWTITKIDTLSALMNPSDGAWDPNLAKAVISKYLSKEGNKLDSNAVNAIGGDNLCSLDVGVLKNISQESLKMANALSLDKCTMDQKQVLFTIATNAFSANCATISTTTYQLLQSYMGGAALDNVQCLLTANVSMDMATFTRLNESVVLALTVPEVKDLLDANLPQLRPYENQSLVQQWIRKQEQSELDILNLGLIGGRVTAIPTSSTNTTATAIPPSSTNTTATANPPSSTNTTATANPPSSTNTTATANPPSSTNTTATANPPSSTNTTATAIPPSSTNTTATANPPSSTNTTATANPPSSTNTTATANPPSSTNTTATAIPPSSTNTTATAIPPSSTNTTATANPPSSTNTTATANPPSSTNTTATAIPTSSTNTTATANPPSSTNTTATAIPPSSTNTTATANPPSSTNTTATANPPSSTNTTATAIPPSSTNTTATAIPPSSTNTTATANPPSSTNTTATANPPSSTNTTATAIPTSSTNTTATANPPSSTNTTATANPPSSTNTTATAIPPSSTNTTATANPPSSTNTTATAIPTSSTNTTATANPPSSTNTTDTAIPPSSTNTTATANPPSSTNTTATANPPSSTNTTATANPPSSTNTTATAIPTSSTNTTVTAIPPSSTNITATTKPTGSTGSTSTSITTTSSTASPGSGSGSTTGRPSTTTGSNCERMRADVSFSLLVFLTLLIALCNQGV
ncbi:uncharacterized protein LOC117525813 [Thalassophryne amazonica]|uniref:uncharacterized protein LOC117525813 n=1 Tax=Thalassophryne amazonica TaxID=390379 RepID=UPI0014713C6F|nr:uncharacterized protein LOC117525813 [Thalassophryne amazonica]